MWYGRGDGGKFESTRPGKVEAEDSVYFVGSGGARLGDNLSMLSGHKVEAIERSAEIQILEAEGMMSWQ